MSSNLPQEAMIINYLYGVCTILLLPKLNSQTTLLQSRQLPGLLTNTDFWQVEVAQLTDALGFGTLSH